MTIRDWGIVNSFEGLVTMVEIAGGELDGSITGVDVYLRDPKQAEVPPDRACQVAKRYVDLYNSGQPAKIADLFDRDAVLLDQTGVDAHGHGQITAYFEKTINQMKDRKMVAVAYLGNDRDCMVELATQIPVQGQLRYALTTIDHFTLGDGGKIIRLIGFSNGKLIRMLALAHVPKN